MKKEIFLTTVLLLVITVSVSANTRLVPTEYASIQAAIDDSCDTDIVIVANGTYTGPGNQDIDFKGKAITVRSRNGPENCIIDCNSGENNEHIGFILCRGETNDSLLEGFTITNGYTWRFCGMFSCTMGGIICVNSSPTIKNCIIKNNTGAGIWCQYSSAVIENCTISNNRDILEGNGINCSDSNLIISNCEITYNECRGISGVQSSVIVKDCNIQGNMEEGINFGLCSITINDCKIRNNMESGIICSNCSAEISNCILSDNSTLTNGGGIQCRGNGIVKIDKCVINNNTSINSYGGGISCSDGITPMISNCTIVNNYARLNGGGVALHLSNASIINSILWGNTSGEQGPQIAVRHTGWPSTLNISFSDVQGGQEAVYVEPECTLNWNIGNINLDPLFADPNNGDFHLESQAGRWDPNTKSWVIDSNTSPSIDAGDWMTPIGLEPFPNGGRINMGAYGSTAEASKSYFSKPPCQTIIAGDINGDCIVNFNDFALLASHWLEER